MLMFVSILFASFVVLAVCTAIISADRTPAEAPPQEMELVLPTSRFFAAEQAQSRPQSAIPVELLLSQIESHVRLEQVAAERFVRLPSTEALHNPTSSPFVN